MCQLGRYLEAKPFLEKAVKQNPRSGALWYLAIVRQHLYDFDGAVEALESYLPALSSDEWLTRADSLMTILQIGQRAYDHCQDVVIIDSLLASKEDFFTYYRLGAESGRIQSDEGEPYFENMTLHLPLGKKLVVKAKNVNEPYIGRMYYNGTVYNHNYLNHDELLKGGTIIYEMQAIPERQRGSKSVDAPYSFSKE